MALFKKKTPTDIIVEAKILYARGDIYGASRLLHSIKRSELSNYGEALYLISKIYLEPISELVDQSDIDRRYKVSESFLQRAIQLGHKDAKVLYNQYFDHQGLPKNNEKKGVKESVVEKEVKTECSKQTEVKEQRGPVVQKQEDYDLQHSKYKNEEQNIELSSEMLMTIRKYVYEYIHQYYSGHSAIVIPVKEEKEVKKLFPALDTDQAIFFYYETVKFKTKWYLFTLFDYYDSFKTHVSIKDVVKTESYYGNVTRLYYKDGTTAEFKFAVSNYRLNEFISRINSCGTALRAKGYEYQSQNDLKRAYEFYLAGALLGDANAQNDLGIFYRTGKYVSQDIDRAIYWYELSAKQGNIHAQSNLGRALRVQKRFDEAFVWLQKCEDKINLSDTTNSLGLCYLNGEGCKVDYDKAIQYFKKASENNNYYADYNLGRIYTYYRVNHKEAFKYYQRAAQKDHTGGLNGLGLAYMNGRAVDVDYDKAIQYFDRSIEVKNDSYAYANKAYLYATCKKDLNKAHELFDKAIELGWKNYSYIADIYTREKFEMVDYNKAIYWLEKGIKENDSNCKFELALMYTDGIGVAQDYNKAFELLSEEDKNSNIKALLGRLYLEGKGVLQNKEKGIRFLNLALEEKSKYVQYYLSCAYIEGVYLPKDGNKSANILLSLLNFKGDRYADKVKEKLKHYLMNEWNNIISLWKDDVLVRICDEIDLEQYPKQQLKIYTNLDKLTNKCTARMYAILAKNYHFGINSHIDYEKAILYYEKCFYSKDYKYDSEIEFNYASLRFEGKGCFKDLTYGFNMAIASGAYNSKCPDNVLPYTKGINKFAELIVKHIKECRMYEYIHCAAKYISLDKEEFAEFKNIIEAKEGKRFYDLAMAMEETLREEKDLIELFTKDTSMSRVEQKRKIDEHHDEYKNIESGVVETLLKAVDYGSFEALEHLSENYSEDLYYNTVYPVENYDFRLMKYYDDAGIIEQGRLLYYAGKDKEAIIKLRDIIVQRRNNDIKREAFDIVYNLLMYVDKLPDIDDVYLDVLMNNQALSNLGNDKVHRISSLKCINERRALPQYVYIDFDINDIDEFEDFLCHKIDYDMYEKNMMHTTSLKLKNKRVIDASMMMQYYDDLEPLLSYGDNIKFEFSGTDNLKDDVFSFIDNYVEVSNFKKLRGKYKDGEYSMLPVKFAYVEDNIYYFWSDQHSKYIKVNKKDTVYIPEFFTDTIPSYMIFINDTPLLVFNVEKQKRLL